MKIGKGMYIRTKKGEIAKIESIEKDIGYKNMEYITLDRNLPFEDYRFHIYKEDIKKASYDIIDLIEVDDIITLNGDDDVYKILCIPDKEVANDDFYLVYTGREFEDIVISPKDMKKNIQTIVTKEQFNNMEYKIGK